jgi:hypothetical protein
MYHSAAETWPPRKGTKLNGGQRSVMSTNAYAATRLFQRITPTTKSKIPRG